MADISSLEFNEALKADKLLHIIDVREPLEFHTFNIGGTNIPLGKIPVLLADDDFDYHINDEIIVLCQHGLRSKTAKVMLQNAGYLNVKNLLGGIVKLQKE
ncbi:MAG: rhodanese-like domain-containing protein [Sphingobacteriales bacterium]|nr:MAG: rhodanese-like domain-containing protein [Sphingobacteriales bacterium]